MKLHLEFCHTHPDKVCHLRKSLYGLKQAPYCWFKKLSNSLLRFEFVQAYDDYLLFSYTKNNIEIQVLIYVDDLLICGNDGYMLQKFKEYLGKCISMKDLRKLNYFLGIEVSRGLEIIFLYQRKYILYIIIDSGFLDSKLAITLLEQNHHPTTNDGPLIDDPTTVACGTPDLSHLYTARVELFGTCFMAVHANVKRCALDVALPVVFFLKCSPSMGILIKAEADLNLTVYYDSNWTSCPLTFFVRTISSSWKTKKHDTLSHFSIKAEYRSMAAAL